MAKSYASLNFDGPLRVDANHAGNKQYAPNSFAHKFRPDTAEAPYAAGDNIVSRKSHYWHGASLTTTTQASELFTRVMSPQERASTCKNTAKYLNLAKFPEFR